MFCWTPDCGFQVISFSFVNYISYTFTLCIGFCGISRMAQKQLHLIFYLICLSTAGFLFVPALLTKYVFSAHEIRLSGRDGGIRWNVSFRQNLANLEANCWWNETKRKRKRCRCRNDPALVDFWMRSMIKVTLDHHLMLASIVTAVGRKNQVNRNGEQERFLDRFINRFLAPSKNRPACDKTNRTKFPRRTLACLCVLHKSSLWYLLVFISHLPSRLLSVIVRYLIQQPVCKLPSGTLPSSLGWTMNEWRQFHHLPPVR